MDKIYFVSVKYLATGLWVGMIFGLARLPISKYFKNWSENICAESCKVLA